MEKAAKWVAKPVSPELIDGAEVIFSHLLCDPDRVNDVKYQVLDELSQRSAFLRGLTEEERRSYWQDYDGHQTPADYRHYKSRPAAAETDTTSANDTFERD
jgi:hypothetical protein